MTMKLVAPLALLLVACGSKAAKTTGDTCAPFSLVADGVAITDLTHGLAVEMKDASGSSLQIEEVNTDAVTCTDVLSKNGRNGATGERSMRAFIGQQASNSGVEFDQFVQMGLSIRRLGAEPVNAGDPVAMCIDNYTFTPIGGPYKDKRVTVGGKLQGTYCGAMDFTHHKK